MRRFFASIATTAAIATAIVTGSAAIATEAGAATTDIAKETRAIELVNAHRATIGCPALIVDARITTAARNHSIDMADRNYFSHYSKQGGAGPQQRLAAAGFISRSTGENIVAAQSDADSAFAAWMASDIHRRNIETCAYTHTGVGYAFNAKARYGHYWTQDFAIA